MRLSAAAYIILVIALCMIHGRGLSAQTIGFRADPSPLGTGPVMLGSSVTRSLDLSFIGDISQLGKDSVLVLSATLVYGNRGFSLPGPIPAQGKLKVSEVPIQFPVRFQPQRAGEFFDELILVGNHDDTVHVTLLGKGVQGLPRLDTVNAVAGELVTLRLTGLPAAVPRPGRDFITVTLRFDPHALVPKSFRVTPDIMDTNMIFVGDSLQLRWIIPQTMSDTTAFADITFRGLSTGQPENIVRLTGVQWGDSTLQPGGDGLVRLSGCDIQRGLRMGKRVQVAGLYIDPASSTVSLTYSASSGVVPELSLFDLTGNRLVRVDLPVATGEDQQVRVPLEHSGRGFHLLELRDGDEHVVLPLMIAR